MAKHEIHEEDTTTPTRDGVGDTMEKTPQQQAKEMIQKLAREVDNISRSTPNATKPSENEIVLKANDEIKKMVSDLIHGFNNLQISFKNQQLIRKLRVARENMLGSDMVSATDKQSAKNIYRLKDTRELTQILEEMIQTIDNGNFSTY